VSSLQGRASLLGRDGDLWRIALAGSDELRAQHVIIATGSIPRVLPQAPLDGVHVVDNSGALAFAEVPKRLVIIGAGVIGLELGSVWRRLGSEVTILEAAASLYAGADDQIAKEALRAFGKQGLKIHLRAQIDRSRR